MFCYCRLPSSAALIVIVRPRRAAPSSSIAGAPPSPLHLPYLLPPLSSLVGASRTRRTPALDNLIVVFWGAASNAPSLVVVRAVHHHAPPPPLPSSPSPALATSRRRRRWWRSIPHADGSLTPGKMVRWGGALGWGGGGGGGGTRRRLQRVIFYPEKMVFYACASDISVGAHSRKKQATLKHHKGNF